VPWLLVVCIPDVPMATSAVSHTSHDGRQDAEADRPLADFPVAILMFLINLIHSNSRGWGAISCSNLVLSFTQEFLVLLQKSY